MSETPPQSRKLFIDCSKGLAIVLIVYGHAMAQFEGTVLYGRFVAIQMNLIFSFALPLFFIVSGSLQRRKLDSPMFDNLSYLKKLCTSFLVPYYLLSILFLVVNVAFAKYVEAPSLRHMILGLLYMQTQGEYIPSGILRILFTLFSCAIGAYLMIRVLRVKHYVILLLSLMLKMVHGYFDNCYILGVDEFTNFFFYYCIGCTFSEHIVDRPPRKKHVLLILGATYLLLALPAFEVRHGMIRWLVGCSLGVLGTMVVLGVFYSLQGASFTNGMLRFLGYCGRYSILIYVFHMPTFTVVKGITACTHLPVNYMRLLLLFVPGVLLPLLYGRLIGANKTLYRTLLGRDP